MKISHAILLLDDRGEWVLVRLRVSWLALPGQALSGIFQRWAEWGGCVWLFVQWMNMVQFGGSSKEAVKYPSLISAMEGFFSVVNIFS